MDTYSSPRCELPSSQSGGRVCRICDLLHDFLFRSEVLLREGTKCVN